MFTHDENVILNTEVGKHWDEIITFTKEHNDISEISFKTWLKPMRLVSLNDNKLTVTVTEKSIGVAYVSKKYKAALVSAIHCITGLSVELIITAE